jgi:uncharacterized damage-inducible protein DinB
VLDKIKRLFEYDTWAIDKTLNALDGIENQRAVRMFAHIIAAKQIWLVRLNGQDSSAIKTHPELSLSECQALTHELETKYESFLSSLNEASLETTITYKNTKGEEFTTPIGEVLTHVAFHSAYHRGQIALLLRQNGDLAVNTDFISFARL